MRKGGSSERRLFYKGFAVESFINIGRELEFPGVPQRRDGRPDNEKIGKGMRITQLGNLTNKLHSDIV